MGLVAPSRNKSYTKGSNAMRYAVNGATVLMALSVQVITFYGVLYA